MAAAVADAAAVAEAVADAAAVADAESSNHMSMDVAAWLVPVRGAHLCRRLECRFPNGEMLFWRLECRILNGNLPFWRSECHILNGNPPFERLECCILNGNPPFWRFEWASQPIGIRRSGARNAASANEIPRFGSRVAAADGRCRLP